MSDEKIIFKNLDLTGKNSRSVAGKDEEKDKVFIDNAKTYFDRYKSERTHYETLWELQDAMYKAGQNRSVISGESSKGANLNAVFGDVDETRAQTSSTQFNRGVSQLSGQFMSVYKSKKAPFSYDPIINPNVKGSDVEGVSDAEIYNLYALWTLRRNNDRKETQEFATHIYKYGCAVEMCYWATEKIGKTKFGFTRFEMFPLKNLYADLNHSKLEDQNCVILCTPRPAGYIINQVDAGEFDSEQVMKLDERHLWDGVEGQAAEDQQTSDGLAGVTNPSDTGFILEWNIFQFTNSPDEGDMKYWWGTILGNSIDTTSGVLVRLEENRDPDGEIPVHLTNALPDDPGRLFHISHGMLVRSNYSAECSLKNQIIDEGTDSLNAPDIIQEGAFPGKTTWDYDKKPWFTQVHPDAAIRRHQTGAASQYAVQLIQLLETDTAKTLNLDKSFDGEEFGQRTSAAEATNIIRNSSQPILAVIDYILAQREPWRGKKIVSYSGEYADVKTVVAITDDAGNAQTIALRKDMNRAFDVDISIVTEFEDTVLKRQALNEMIGIIASNPEVAKRVDIDEVLRERFLMDKFQASKMLKPDSDGDARFIASSENNMFMQGTYISPEEGQNHRQHNADHNALKVQYNGLPPEFLESHGVYGGLIEFLDRHMEEHNMLDQQGRSAPAHAGQRNQTEGQAIGNTYAGVQGAGQPQL